jgi:hypothetical protein
LAWLYPNKEIQVKRKPMLEVELGESRPTCKEELVLKIEVLAEESSTTWD